VAREASASTLALPTTWTSVPSSSCSGPPLALPELAGERGEVADVVPAELRRHHRDPSPGGERLGERVVDRDRGHRGPDPLEHLLRLVGAVRGGDLPRPGGERRDLRGELVEQHARAHDEHAGVPAHPRGDELLGPLPVGLLDEARDGHGANGPQPVGEHGVRGRVVAAVASSAGAPAAWM
jgi:hypothetical protein